MPLRQRLPQYHYYYNYWLPVRQRIDFKVMVLVYKSLHRLAPPYLSDDCQLVTDVGRRHLRSADVHSCTVPRTQSRLGDRSFGSPDHGCGTVCLLNCDSKTFASPSLGGYLRHFCSLILGALWLLCFNGAGYKHSYLLTYLLTYLYTGTYVRRWVDTKSVLFRVHWCRCRRNLQRPRGRPHEWWDCIVHSPSPPQCPWISSPASHCAAMLSDTQTHANRDLAVSSTTLNTSVVVLGLGPWPWDVLEDKYCAPQICK